MIVLNPPHFFSQVDLPLVDGSYKWADGKSVGTYDSTIVVIQTDHPDGIVGYNFTCHNCQSIPFFLSLFMGLILIQRQPKNGAF